MGFWILIQEVRCCFEKCEVASKLFILRGEHHSFNCQIVLCCLIHLLIGGGCVEVTDRYNYFPNDCPMSEDEDASRLVARCTSCNLYAAADISNTHRGDIPLNYRHSLNRCCNVILCLR